MSEIARYSRAQIALHWGVLILLVVSFFSHDGMKDAFRAALKGEETGGAVAVVHRLVGIAILLLTLARIGLRWRVGAPALPEGGHPLLDLAAKATHLAIYALLIAIPASGLVAWLGLNRDAGGAHEVMFTVLFVLVGLHAAAALFHQFVLKDGLMARMRPGR